MSGSRARLEVSHNTAGKGQRLCRFHILLALILVGFLRWLVNRFIPMGGSIKSNGSGVIGVVLWRINVFGIFHSLSRIQVG